MTKLVTYLWLCCYLLLTTGVVATSHYCKDSIAAVSLFTSGDPKCGQCGSSRTTDGRCTDQEILLKLTTSHYKATALGYQGPVLEQELERITGFFCTPLENGFLGTHKKDRPPLLSAPPIYLWHHVFRI